jgi:exonuclease VII small subunit
MVKIKTTNDAGEEVEIEAITPEELAEEKTKMETEFNNKLAEKETAVETLQREKQELEDKLNGNTNADHPNFKTLKDALAKKDEEINSIKTEIESSKKQLANDEFEIGIQAVTKGDKELEKKIKFHLEKTLTGLKENTKAERAAKLQAALKLSVDVDQSQEVFDSGIGGGGRGNDVTPGANGPEFTSRERALGTKLGITEADYKKYGGRVK